MVKYYKDELSHIFYALADNHRRQILDLVAQRPRKASELACRFNISFPAISKHIKILEEAGFVKRKVCGREHHICIEHHCFKKAHHWIEDHRRFWEESLDRLEDYLGKLEQGERREKKKST